MCVKPRESIFLAVLLVGTASGATLHVPTDFPTIQSAIDAADLGDEIVVAPGNYQERIDYGGKEIRLRSSGGPRLTIIDGSGETGGTTVRIAPRVGPNALLQGFTITGGTSHGVHVDTDSDPTIRDCIFRGNSSTFVGGGLLLEGNSVVTVVNCVFIDNVASTGGGMAVIIATPIIVNCTFFRNVATSDANFSGGGLFNLDSFITIRNSIFWGNTGPESLEEQQIGGPVPSLFSVDYCIIQGLTDFFGGDGNIDTDPRFVDPENGELSLLPGSSAIDAGRNDALPAGIDKDLIGNVRFVDDPDSPDCAKPGADCGTRPIVDMGAFEFQVGGEPIPTTSQWGLIAMTLLILTAATLIFLPRDSGRSRVRAGAEATTDDVPIW